MKNLLILVALLCASCALFARPPQEDKSIKFPSFHESFATIVGKQGQPYELDGVTLRAISIAANDFIPPGHKSRSCWDRQESHSYRVIRQGDVIFVQISSDPASCKQDGMVLDGGVKYAISTDGRILRRLFDGEPENFSPDSQEAEQKVTGGSYFPASKVGGVWAETAPGLPASWFDGGTQPAPAPTPPIPDAGSPAPDGGSPALDGGSPEETSATPASDAG